MGHHYVPRHHLRRFSTSGKKNCVWMYDKQTRVFSEVGINGVAQEKAYYDPEIEEALAGEIEAPGKLIIDKLLNREVIDDGERTKLSLYFMIMLSRGPRQRRKSTELVPGIRDQVIKETELAIKEWITDEHENSMAYSRLQELEHAREEFLDEIPQNVIDIIRRPHFSESTVECIFNMCWHILPVHPGMHFVTCDTPAHSFECFGLGNLESEYTITLSKDFALIGEHKRKSRICYERSNAKLVKEVNRRILSHAERFVFSPRKVDWIEAVAQKKDPFLSRISW